MEIQKFKSGVQSLLALSPEDEDLRKLCHWFGNYAGMREGRKSQHFLLHRYIVTKRMGVHLTKEAQVDHINRIKLDCRRENLRVVSSQENNLNRSSVLGYSFSKRDKLWVAYVTRNYKNIYLGYFKSKEEAISARVKYLEIERKSPQ